MHIRGVVEERERRRFRHFDFGSQLQSQLTERVRLCGLELPKTAVHAKLDEITLTDTDV
jgi:hypothetical protein